jgi:hypothetical protein
MVAARMHMIGVRSIRSGWDAFRLALGVLIALCASANAATAHHFQMRDHVTIQPSEGTFVPGAAGTAAATLR